MAGRKKLTQAQVSAPKNYSDVKVRLLAVERIFMERKCLTMPELHRILCYEYDIQADRKTLYDDIAALTRFLPIYTEGYGRGFRYVMQT